MTATPEGEIHVWEADLDAAGWPGPQSLPAAERERAERLLRPLGRRRWVAARWALRGVLGRYTDLPPAEIELRAGDGGKPRLEGAEEGLRFNLSHSHGLAAVAVAVGAEVGIDIEWIDPDRDIEALAPRALDATGAERVVAAPPARKPEVFHAAWTRREAVGKCLGVGLASPPPGARVAVAPLEVRPGFAAAVAIAAESVPPLRRFEIAP
ncbi:MAG TPA: 4'-phosphopantetheinyl transferase superfamily protein [Solirubrobacterales bacterium]|jgi:4'-phosphopantetheinyl transferase|nr:4'-phosphopantetheinyl transferase superfamily protein [Solirubrobacterales bacterium]